MSEQEIALRQTVEELKKQGLLDVKFAFAPLQERTAEEVYASVNEVFRAVMDGETDDLPVK